MTCSFARVALVLFAGALVAGCGKKDDAAAAATTTASSDSGVVVTQAQRGQIQTAKVDRSSFSPDLVETGTVQFNGDHSTQVIAAISGPVSRILSQPGDQVTAGQAMALVSSPDFASAVADFRKADAAFRNSQRIVNLDEKLFAGDALARADLDQARSDLDASTADREATLLQLRSLGVDSASIDSVRMGRASPGTQSAIRAPIAGTVVEKLITPGQLLEAGTTPAFTIADLSTMWVMGNVFESDIGSVVKGEPVIITTDASPDSLRGTVDYVGALVDPSSKAAAVRILVPNRDHILKQNMLVNLVIHSSRPRTGITLPVAAVLLDDDNLPYVYVENGSNRFIRRRITLGSRTGDRYEVAGGIQPGDTVVTQGALYLQEASSQ